jgi:hypothetical protein
MLCVSEALECHFRQFIRALYLRFFVGTWRKNLIRGPVAIEVLSSISGVSLDKRFIAGQFSLTNTFKRAGDLSGAFAVLFFTMSFLAVSRLCCSIFQKQHNH